MNTTTTTTDITDTTDTTDTTDNILNDGAATNSEEQKEAHDFCLSTSLEFLLNKKVYKKIMDNGNCLQTKRENEERKHYIVKYNSELLQLFTSLLNDPENVIVSQEIHNIFESFVDKSVKYFIRTNEMLNKTKYDDDDDPDDDPDDDDDDAPDEQWKTNEKRKKMQNYIFPITHTPFANSKKNAPQMKKGGNIHSSNWGDDILLDEK
jgi:hypothetical protein